jgi:hypothetical protein
MKKQTIRPPHLWQDSLEPNVRAELQRLLHYVQSDAIANRMWTQLFADAERQRIGDLAAAYRKSGTIAIWQSVRGGSQPRAIIDISRQLGLISAAVADWLIHGIGESTQKRSSSGHPRWDSATGVLTWNGKQAGRFRIMSTRSAPQQLLDAFEAAGWPSSLPSPLRNADDGSTRQVLHYMNHRLRGILFRSSKGGKQITWSPAAKSN